MLTKAQVKYIKSLSLHKYRNEYKEFVAEGAKIVQEWLESDNQVQIIVAVKEWVDNHLHLIAKHTESKLFIVEETILASLSSLNTPNNVLIVAKIPDLPEPSINNQWYLALDDIQDPGNMGTIIRIADWFGIDTIFCSPSCVDAFNPKVIQAAMGGHLRVKIYKTELADFLTVQSLPKFASVLNGENIFKIKPYKCGILIIGNESKGISEAVLATATKNITIPRIGKAESLNAGVSAGILCALLTK